MARHMEGFGPVLPVTVASVSVTIDEAKAAIWFAPQ
jgi:hypothetical protein